MKIQGVRAPDNTYPHRMKPGEYAKQFTVHTNPVLGPKPRGHVWYAVCPCDGELIANLAGHEVTEHEDGTITVSPSILCDKGPGQPAWHGFLERGVWREA